MVGWWLYVAKINSPQGSVSVVWRSSLCAGMSCVDMYIPVVGELISSISALSKEKVSCSTGCGMQYTYVYRYATGTPIRTYTVCM